MSRFKSHTILYYHSALNCLDLNVGVFDLNGVKYFISPALFDDKGTWCVPDFGLAAGDWFGFGVGVVIEGSLRHAVWQKDNGAVKDDAFK